MVHAASQEIVAVTAHLPRLAQRPSGASSKRSDQAGAHATVRTARVRFLEQQHARPNCARVLVMLLWRPTMQVAARSLPQPPSFQDNIATDEEAVSRPIAAITAAVTGIVDKVQTLLVYWEKKYQSVWDQDKEAYIRCAPCACSVPYHAHDHGPRSSACGVQQAVRESPEAVGRLRGRHYAVCGPDGGDRCRECWRARALSGRGLRASQAGA